MKQSILLLFFVLSLCLVSCGQTDQKSKKALKQTEIADQQKILQMEEALRKAKVDNNTQAIAEMYAEEYQGINQYGNATNKARRISTWANRKNLTLVLDTVSVTLVSDTEAITNGLQTEDGVQMSFERKFVKQGGKWRIIAARQKMLEYKGTRGIGKYRINGHLSGADGVAVSLMTTNVTNGKTTNLNAAIIKEGSFVMEGNALEYPQLVSLTTPGKNERANFYLENSEITITGHLDSLSKLKVTGSKTQDEFSSFLKAMEGLSVKSGKLFKELQASGKIKDSTNFNQIKKEMEPIRQERISIFKDFVKNNPGSYAVPIILLDLGNSLEDISELEPIVQTLDPDVARTPAVIVLKSRIRDTKAVAIGQKAPGFTLNDVNGNPISLSSKIGPKLLLVDFWAAWCAPCRAENPNVLKVYNEFKNKGFDILGVSLDRTKEDWIKAIEKDHLTWTQVSDLLYFNSAAARIYLVGAIPANFLLDQNGTIIAKNLRGEVLYNKVKELLSVK